MSIVSDEIRAIIAGDENALAHVGTKYHSGRYPYGSGQDDKQHGHKDFLSRVESLKAKGWSETPENIMNQFGLTTGQYREEKGKCQTTRRMDNIHTAQAISGDLGMHPLTNRPQYSAIGAKMGVRESTVRGWLDNEAEKKTGQAQEIANLIKKQIEEKGMIDVGPGIEAELGIPYTKLNRALSILQDEGYPVYSGGVKQPTNPGQQTTQRVIGPPGTLHKDIFRLEDVHTLSDYHSDDGGETFRKFVYPKSLDSKRMHIRYADEKGSDKITGLEKDGIVELRRGVDDLSLGGKKYSQVRILVDNTHYIKGMAVYSDHMPDGVDIVFNTNKPKGMAMTDVLKPVDKNLKKDPSNPFGSNIKAGGQSYYTDKNGKQQLSLINKRADEGDWTEWKDTLPSQFLSKQSLPLAKKQLDLAIANKFDEFDSIMKLDNPTIKKHLLYKFADECEAAAVHLQAASLPGQKYHVIIPINTLKDNEIYAPQYATGTKLALVRYPHGGTFEIPILTVNNTNALGKKIISPGSVDAVGITKAVADRLSGADFDGDTAMCIPTHNGKVRIASTPELKGLKGFDAKEKYGVELRDDGEYYNRTTGNRVILMKNDKTGTDNTQQEMGKISNLVNDMTLGGASDTEKAAAVRHSMTVIDAGKHKLDYKQSEIDNNIKSLKARYQRKIDSDGNVKVGGASTIISRASSQATVDKRQGTPKINKKGEDWYDPTKPEGSYIYKTADNLEYQKTSINKRTGEVVVKTVTRTQKSTKMGEVEDAFDLVSEAKHPMELVYAEFANNMKDMARKARIDYLGTEKIAYNKEAAKVYSKEVAQLKAKITDSRLNKPKEREVLRKSNVEINAKLADYKESHGSDMKNGDVKKLGQATVEKYRAELGAIPRRLRNIDINDREWEAIQSGAVSEKTLKDILDNTDIGTLRQRAMPKEVLSFTPAQTNRIQSLSNSGYTLGQIAEKMNVSATTISKCLKGVL